MQESGYLNLEHLTDAIATANGFAGRLAHEHFRVDVITENLLRMKISRGGTFDENPSFALVVDPLTHNGFQSQDRAFNLEIGADSVRLTTASLVLTVNTDKFGFDLRRIDGSRVFASGEFGYRILNNDWRISRGAARGDAIYGLGEKTGKQNRRGRDFHLWNTDVLNPNAAGEFTKAHPETHPRADSTSTEFDPYYVSIPFFYQQDEVTGAVGGSFIDNGYRGFYNFTAADSYEIAFGGGQYTEYLFGGPDFASILADYTALTGRAQLPPIWALGYHQCRWHDYSQQDVLDLAKRHRELDLPLDTLWLDIDYMDGYRVFTWNHDRFPDVPAMLRQLDEQGIRVITIIDPGVKFDPGYEVFDAGLEGEVFCLTEGGDIYIGQVWPGNTAFPDFAKPETRKWWGELNAQHVASGIAGIWNDMNEPATGGISEKPMRFGAGAYSHEKYHNQYALLMAMGTAEGLLAARPELRTFILSRAGSPGIQRYAANWLGDNMSRWDHLWLQIPMATGLSLSGQSFVGADIGGFAENSNPELFARWMQAGLLTPFARNHNQTNQLDQYAFAWGQEVLDIAREAIKLRYRLMPYLYSAFVENSLTGAPIQRPLVYQYQHDAEVWEVDDQYLLGGDLLVAPILEAGKTSRSVYLPAGEWVDWHSGDSIESRGERINVEAPLTRIPIFARAGAAIALWSEVPVSTAGYYPEEITVLVALPIRDGSHTSVLVEDDGLTFEALAEKKLTTQFTVTRSGGTVALRGVSQGLGFKDFNRKRLRIRLIGLGDLALQERVVENTGEDFEAVFNL